MLKITRSDSDHGTTIALSGRLVGPWVGELLDFWLRAKAAGASGLHIDLREVTFVDGAGRALLGELHRQGVTIQASGCLMRAIVAEVTGVDASESPRGASPVGGEIDGSSPRLPMPEYAGKLRYP